MPDVFLARLGRGRISPLLVSSVVAALAVLAGGLASYFNAQAIAQASELVAHTHRVESQLDAVLSALKDAETGQRGYLLTGRDDYLTPYRDARVELPARLDRLRALTGDDPGQRGRVDDLGRVADGKLAELERTIELRRAGETNEALAVVQTDLGRRLMVDARTLVGAMRSAEDRRLSERVRAAQVAYRRTTTYLAASTLLTLALVATVSWAGRSAAGRVQQSAEWLAVTLRSIGDAVIATDESGRVQFMNPVAERLTGWPAPEANGRPLAEVFRVLNEETRAPVEHPVATVLREGGVVGLANHTLLLARDGPERPIFDSGAPIRDDAGRVRGVVLVFMDVTARRAAERELRAREARLRAIVEQAAVGIEEVAEDGRLLRVNAALCGLLGYSQEELLALRFTDITHPDDLAADVDRARRLFAGEFRAFTLEKRYVRKDGAPIWILLTSSAVRGEPGETAYRVSVIQDIDERRRAVDEVRRLNSELEARVATRTRELSEANAELESFSYTIAHDLRAPVRNMHALAEALVEDFAADLPAEGHDYAHRIVAAAVRMDALIQDLLAYARLSRVAVRLQGLDLDDVIADALALLRAELDERGAAVAVDRPLGRVLAQRTTLGQVVTNLVGNAVKFVRPGQRPSVRVRSEARGPNVRLWVEDDGIGIDAEHRERIFRVFERLHAQEAYPGTGIGLAIVRKGVERMGGSSGVESEPGRGSRFWIELPAREAP